MTDFLLELRCEEIPARMQLKASDDLARLFTEELAKAGLKPASIDSFVTPRRLALIARDLPLETAAVSEEFKGPRTSAPAQALEGFLRKTGLTQEQLEDRDGVWFAVVNKPGRATTDVLAEAVPAVIRAFPWPKSMRWGAASATTESLRWVRPLQGIIALLGGEIVQLSIEGIEAGRETVGHRFHSTGAIRIDGADDYADKLRAAYVIVSHQERQAIIEAKAGEAAAAKGYSVIEDKGLVAENAGLTEWPVPLLGDFDPEFLEVPPEVIQLTLRINQKYFVLRDAGGKLAPAFICTANIEAKDGGVAIVAGNRKVLAARLSDARFFWQQDRKTPLAEQAKKLGRITFHEKLGTVADKVERIAKLAEWLASEGIVPNCDPALARQAAELCKADLVTEMVGEFPELQGVMGGYYARAEGLPDAVADAIRDHYKPVGQGDDVPTAPVTVAVSLADKLDTLRSFFGIDEKPTGSRDPFALRRAALGVIQIVTANGLRMPVAEGDLLDFFADRLKVQQKEAGVRHDLIDAVFALGGEDDLVRLLARVKALQSFIATDDGANLLAGYKRAANILKKEAPDLTVTPAKAGVSSDGAPTPEMPASAGMTNLGLSYEPEKAEADLIAALDAAEPQAAQAVAAEEFEGAMAALATLRAPIDAFFETVTVNDADPAKRTTRLALLARVRDAVHNVADFSKITG
ncbi:MULTISPECIES: glycine--tRNA ligase subunit beta [Sphingobium]|uniref:Glycine--tRNA ligase beta subunit n=1 Tax=Sphingobium yanoikuyae ATCC 51230 TaxID=883163 RepID=K9CYL5_SPHYA|nr:MULTISPECIES: glycine--tRNA ligase subunit beta [Sphingobium]EKU77138.1 glycine-tRNA ligase, beta subunit [Sphingobium yanoikuyae ATCC 51230]WQE09224.1 glycine--tRNA ligase subunit beta [Sphingobium yanoikuyae]SHM26907.1 glycyl-tRNA synthetase beta chain [Sphingobium sp. YR657]